MFDYLKRLGRKKVQPQSERSTIKPIGDLTTMSIEEIRAIYADPTSDQAAMDAAVLRARDDFNRKKQEAAERQAERQRQDREWQNSPANPAAPMYQIGIADNEPSYHNHSTDGGAGGTE